MLALSAGGLAATRCAPAPSPAPTSATLPATAALPPTHTATATSLPTSSPTPLPPSATPTPAFQANVGIQRAENYDPAAVRRALQALLDGPGGLGDAVRPGARVAIKVNLTGGAIWNNPQQAPPTEVYLTHPEVVKALCELLRDAGASKIFVVEGVYEAESYPVFGYTEALKAVGAELVDLNWYEPFKSFTRVAVPNPLVYETFTLNPALVEIDSFISVAKLKVHYTAGITLALKNLVGISPLGYYRNQEAHNYRSALHGGLQDGIDRRLIRAIIDLNHACPIHYALIDGIWTSEGGEGPWQKTMQQVKPGILIGGRDPVAVDVVGTAAMGFDPAAPDRSTPFIRSENYLRLAGESGLGTGDMAQIGVHGAPIAEVRIPFRTTN